MVRCLHTKSLYVEDTFVMDKLVGMPIKAKILQCNACKDSIFVTKYDTDYISNDGVTYIRLRFGIDEG